MSARSGGAVCADRKAEVFCTSVIRGLAKRIDRFVEFANSLLAAAVNSTVVADENLTVGSAVWLPAESIAPGR
jgi:hypothetical protein